MSQGLWAAGATVARRCGAWATGEGAGPRRAGAPSPQQGCTAGCWLVSAALLAAQLRCSCHKRACRSPAGQSSERQACLHAAPLLTLGYRAPQLALHSSIDPRRQPPALATASAAGNCKRGALTLSILTSRRAVLRTCSSSSDSLNFFMATIFPVSLCRAFTTTP